MAALEMAIDADVEQVGWIGTASCGASDHRLKWDADTLKVREAAMAERRYWQSFASVTCCTVLATLGCHRQPPDDECSTAWRDLQKRADGLNGMMAAQEASKRFLEFESTLEKVERVCTAAGKQDILPKIRKVREAFERMVMKTAHDAEQAAPIASTSASPEAAASKSQLLAALGAIVARPTSFPPASVSRNQAEHSVEYTYAAPLDGVKLTVYDVVASRWSLDIEASSMTPDDLSPGGASFLCQRTSAVDVTRHYRIKSGPFAGSYVTTWTSDPGVVSVSSYETMRNGLADEQSQGLVNVGNVDEYVRSTCDR